MVSFQESVGAWEEILSGHYVGVEAQVFVVGVLITSVSLVSHGFYC